MTAYLLPLDELEVEDKEIQPPAPRDPGILLAQGSRRRVPRVFKRFLDVYKRQEYRSVS